MKPTTVTQSEEVYSFRDIEIPINGLTFASVWGEIRYEVERVSDRLPISAMPDVEITKVLSADIEQYSVFTRAGDDMLYVGSSNNKDADWKDRSFIDWLSKRVSTNSKLLKDAADYERIYL